jgi:nucleotide-binding universal stress UspA family protein
VKRIQHVLVAIDLSDGSRGALASAAVLARALGARLTALYVSPRFLPHREWSAFAPTAPLDAARKNTLEEDLRRFVTPEGAELPLAHVEVREGDAAREILAYARQGAADLIVLGMHSRRPIERWFLGSVTEQVARKAECPTMAVPWALEAPAFARVVCGVDLSDSSAETLAQAAAAALALRARLVVLHAVDGPHGFEPWVLTGQTAQEARNALCEHARQELTRLASPYRRAGLRAEVRVQTGEPQAVLEQVLCGDIDLAVVGVHPSRGVDRFFFGSTAGHVLRTGVCPVLLVPHGPARVTATVVEASATIGS